MRSGKSAVIASTPDATARLHPGHLQCRMASAPGSRSSTLFVSCRPPLSPSDRGTPRRRRAAPGAGPLQRRPHSGRYRLLQLNRPATITECPLAFTLESVARSFTPALAAVASVALTRCLTLRSSRAPTAGHAGPVGGTRCIFPNRARASHRRCRLSSNVRPHRTECLPPTTNLVR